MQINSKRILINSDYTNLIKDYIKRRESTYDTIKISYLFRWQLFVHEEDSSVKLLRLSGGWKIGGLFWGQDGFYMGSPAPIHSHSMS